MNPKAVMPTETEERRLQNLQKGAIYTELSELNMRDLTQINNKPFLLRLAVYLACSGALIYLILNLSFLPSICPMILLGLMYAHAVELQHQTLHNTAFSSRKLNRWTGIFLGLPMLVSFSDYQDDHLRHHRNLGTPQDREHFNYGYEALTSIGAFTPHLFMLRHYRDVVVNIVKAILGKQIASEMTRKEAMLRIRQEYLIMAVFLISMLIISVGLKTTIFLKLWLIPLIFAIPCHALIELPEHIGCNKGTMDVFTNTRTIKASWFGVWFTNGNNYHIEHHLLPGIPNDKLKDVHQIISPKIKSFEPSYWSFYRGFLRSLYSGRRS